MHYVSQKEGVAKKFGSYSLQIYKASENLTIWPFGFHNAAHQKSL